MNNELINEDLLFAMSWKDKVLYLAAHRAEDELLRAFLRTKSEEEWWEEGLYDKEPSQNLIEEVNKLDTKVNEMVNQSLKFSFSRQEYVNEVKDFKKIYIYAVSRTVIEKVIERLDLHAEVTRKIDEADVVIAHKAYAKGGNKILSTANDYKLPIYYVRSNSMAQIQKVLKEDLLLFLL